MKPGALVPLFVALFALCALAYQFGRGALGLGMVIFAFAQMSARIFYRQGTKVVLLQFRPNGNRSAGRS